MLQKCIEIKSGLGGFLNKMHLKIAKVAKIAVSKRVFWPLSSLGEQKNGFHIKLKSKIIYLGEKNSILPRQMAEQLAVEVRAKK